LIFYVTSQCNARCQTCFFWKDLNTGHGLTIEQIERLALTMPKFRTLLIGGGEPFLRLDLPEIVSIFHKRNRIRDASIPTNGLLPTRIEEETRRILSDNPDLYLSLNVSLDGFAATHDEIRGVPGNFDRARETLQRLIEARGTSTRLSVILNSVICEKNYEEIVSFAEFAWNELNVDGHFFEIIRGDPKDLSVGGVPAAALADIYQALPEIQARYFRRLRGHQNRVSRMVGGILDVGRLLWQYRTQYRRYTNNQLWTVPCLAGRTIGVVEPDGTLKACELRERISSLADSGWDFGSQWYGSDTAGEVEQVSIDECDCTHVCFIQSSRDHSLRATFVESPRLWLRYRRGQEWL
jgi:MoaA/NifB/PqqE/SkfB family radical SAM enzyme